MRSKLNQYPQYRVTDSEFLGEIPVKWQVLRGKLVFDEITELSKNGDETLLSVSEYYGVKPRNEVIDEGEFLSRAESLIGYKKCIKNDLVMNIMLAWKRGLGVTDFEGIVSPAYSVFRFKENAIPQYMHYLLRTDLYTGHFKTRSTGVIDSRLRLYPDSFADVPILLPSIDEQRKIVEFLNHETNKIDMLINKQQSLIKLLKEKRIALISTAVSKGLKPDVKMKDSGIEWLGQVPQHWSVISLKHLVSTPIIDGPHVSPVSQDEGVPFISAEAISGGVINFEKIWGFISARDSELFSRRYSPKKGDILMVKLGATTGTVAFVDTDKMFNIWVPLAAIRIQNNIPSKYIYYLLQSSNIRDAIQLSWTYGTQQTLGLGTLANLKLPIPPKSECEKIIEYIESKIPLFEISIEKSEKSLLLLQERRAAVIDAAVTGKIDVRSWQPPKQKENQPQDNKKVTA